MKQTKTRRALLIVTLMMLVLTLGFGLLFMQREKASADGLELVPLADAELLATKSYSSRGEPTATGPYWDARRSQLRLFFKVNGGDYAHGNTVGANWYGSSDKIFLTVNGEEKPMSACGLGWVDSVENGNGDGPSVYQVWLCHNNGATFFDTVTEIKIATGFQYKATADDVSGPATARDYYLWKGTGTDNWQTRITSFTATYEGRLEQNGTLDPSKLNVTAQFKDGTSGTVAGSAIKVGELDTSNLGAKQVTLTYQDKTFDLFVTVEEKRTLNDITLEGVDGITAERWTYPTFDSLVVKADFEGEEPTTLSKSEYTVTGYDTWAAGEKTTATVTYNYGETQKTKTFDITLTDNTATDKYFEILDDEAAPRNVNSAFPPYYSYGLSFRVNFVGIEGADLRGLNLPNANYYFNEVKGIHLKDFIEILYDGEPKSATELFASGDMEHISFTDSGKLVLCFKNEDARAKVTQVTFKAGMQIASNQNAFDFSAPQSTLDSTAVFIDNGVLKRDYVYSNGGEKGWLKVVDTITATYASEEMPLDASDEEVKAKLTVKVKYKGETTETTLNAADYELSIDTSEISDSVEGTVSYRGKTATFNVKVVEAKELDRIELSGTTEFTAKRFETAPELTGFTVTAYYVGQDQGVELETGFTVGTVDMWDTVGDHDIKVSYTEAGKTVEANLKLTIEAPDTTKGLEVLHDGNHDCGNTHKTDWDPTQLSFFVKAKGEVPTLSPTVQPDTSAWKSAASHVKGYILINGEEFDTWSGHVGWIYYFENQTSKGEENVYEIWLCTGQDQAHKDWKSGIKTVTIKAGFHISNPADPNVLLVVKEDVTLWNAHEAGWQQKATSLEASVKQGADLTAGANINDILDVKAVYGAENKKAITGYTVEGYDKSKTVAQTVTVKYQDVQTTVEVTLTAPASVPEEITLDKNTLTVNQFELADFSAITATVKFTGDKADVTFKLNALPTQATLSAIDTWEKGEKKVTLTYSEGGVDITVEITVTVGDPDTTKGLKVLHDYAENAAKTWWWSQPANQTSQMLIYFDVFGEGVAEIDTSHPGGGGNLVFKGKEHFDNYILINGKSLAESGFPGNGWVGSFYPATPYEMDGRIDAHTLWFDPSYAAGYATMSEWRDTVKTVTIKAGFQWYDKNGPVAGAVVKEDITIYNAQSSWQRLATGIEVAKKADAKILVGTEDIRPMLDVKAVYSETDKQAVPGYTIEGYKKDTVGKQTITIKFQTFEKPLEIEVEEEKVKVKFDLNGGTGIPQEQEIVKGSKLTRPATDPTREGYTFDGWFTSKNGGSEYDFNATVDDDLTIFAQWVENTTPGGDTPTTPGGDTPTTPDTPDTPAEEEGGCGSVIEGPGIYVGMALMLGATVAIVLAVRRKRD